MGFYSLARGIMVKDILSLTMIALALPIAAGVVGIAAAVASELQGSSSSVYSGVAILPLAPGFILYTGMLAIAQGDNSTAVSARAERR